MSIADKLTKLNTDITNAYNSISAKGGTIPINKNTENLASAIGSIECGGEGIGLVAIYIETIGKTKYDLGEHFTLNEYVIKAVYTNEAPKDVTSLCTFTPSGELTANDKSITISYTEAGITKTVVQEIIIIEQRINYTMLYDYGNMGESGDWEWVDITYSGSTSSTLAYFNNPIFTKNNNSMSINVTTQKDNKNYRGSIQPINTFDVSVYNMLFIKNSVTSTAKDSAVRIWCSNEAEKNDIYPRIWISAFYEKNTSGVVTNQKQNCFYNFSTPTGNHKIVVGVQHYDTSGTTSINVYHLSLFKPDDWITLASLAGITASSIEEILANSTVLLANEEAVNYMIYKCTGDFMASAIQNETFLTALNNSQYKTIIWANEHWAKFLNMVA